MDINKVNETKEKLKKAFDLEMKLYECNQLISYFDNALKYEPKKEIYNESFNENQYHAGSVADYYEGNDWFEYGQYGLDYLSNKVVSKTIVGIVFIIIGLLVGIFYSYILFGNSTIYYLPIIISTIAATIFSYIGLIFFRKAFDFNYAKNRLKKANSVRDLEVIKAENLKKSDKSSMEDRIKQKNDELEAQYQNTLVVVDQTKKIILEKKNEKENERSSLLVQLKNHYDESNIVPSYRNLIAISTIYGYFVNNRMYELEGPDGAYNLFEQEMMNKMIILELESINKNLSSIRDNQQQLLGALKETNRLIEDEISAIYRSSENVIRSNEFVASSVSGAINHMRETIPYRW